VRGSQPLKPPKETTAFLPRFMGTKFATSTQLFGPPCKTHVPPKTAGPDLPRHYCRMAWRWQREVSQLAATGGRLLIESSPDGRAQTVFYGFLGQVANAQQTPWLAADKHGWKSLALPSGFVATDYATLNLGGFDPRLMIPAPALLMPRQLHDGLEPLAGGQRCDERHAPFAPGRPRIAGLIERNTPQARK